MSQNCLLHRGSCSKSENEYLSCIKVGNGLNMQKRGDGLVGKVAREAFEVRCAIGEDYEKYM